MPQYNRAQFIAINMQTRPGNWGDDVAPQQRSERFRSGEIQRKILVLINLINYTFIQVVNLRKPGGNVLRIVVFPEFYFMDPIGAYDVDDIIYVFESVRGLIRGLQIFDCIIVLGSIVATVRNADGSATVMNICPIIACANNPNGEIGMHFVYKEYLANNDLLRPAALGGPRRIPAWGDRILGHEEGVFPETFLPATPVYGARVPPPPGPAALGGGVLGALPPVLLGSEYSPNENIPNGGGYFSFPFIQHANGSQILFSLELCLDHIRGRIRSIHPHAPPAPFRYFSHVHIIPSCGLSPRERVGGCLQNTVCGQNGLAFYVDGQLGAPAEHQMRPQMPRPGIVIPGLQPASGLYINDATYLHPNLRTIAVTRVIHVSPGVSISIFQHPLTIPEIHAGGAG